MNAPLQSLLVCGVVAAASASLAAIQPPFSFPLPPTGPAKTEVWRSLRQKIVKAPPLVNAASLRDSEIQPYVGGLEYFKNGAPQHMAGLIYRHLRLAEALLASVSAERRRSGLAIAQTAAYRANKDLKDARLAARICDAYVLPNLLSSAHPVHWEWGSKQEILPRAASIYDRAGEVDKFIVCYQLLLQYAHSSNTADCARLRIAEGLAKKGEYEKALPYLEAIDPQDSMSGARRLIPTYQRKLQEQKDAKTSRP